MTVTQSAAATMAVDSLRCDAERVARVLEAAGFRSEVRVDSSTDAAVGALLAGPITTTVTITLRLWRPDRQYEIAFGRGVVLTVGAARLALDDGKRIDRRSVTSINGIEVAW